MGAKRGGDASEYWRIYDELRGDRPEKEIIADAKINGSSTLSMWKNRSIFPTVDIGVRLAEVLETTPEYMVNRKRPVYLLPSEQELLKQAHTWRSVLEDLDALEPTIATALAAGIHAAAIQPRGPVREELGERPPPPTEEDLRAAARGSRPLFLNQAEEHEKKEKGSA